MVFWAFLYRFLFISLYLTSCCAYHRSIAGSYSVHPCRARTNGKFKRNECVCVCVVRLGIREFYFTIYLNYVTPFLLLLLLWLATAVTHAPQTFRTCRYMHIAFVYVFFLSRFSNPYGAWIVCWAQDAPTVDAHTHATNSIRDACNRIEQFKCLYFFELYSCEATASCLLDSPTLKENEKQSFEFLMSL